MKKSIFALACLPLCLIACKPKTEKPVEPDVDVQEQQIPPETLEPVVDNAPSFVDNTPIVEVNSSEYNQILLEATVKAAKVDLRYEPNDMSEIGEQVEKGSVLYVIGFDKNYEETNHGINRWVQVKKENETWASWYWVPSAALNMNQSIKTSKITFNSCGKLQDICELKIDINRQINGITETVDVIAWDCGEFYSFTWNAGDEGFNYADPVGTFIWNPQTNAIEHFSVLGGGMESGWSKPTPDKKYLIVDYGTSAGMRSFSVYSMKDNCLIFTGGYYDDVKYENDTVISLRACSYDDEGAQEFKSKEIPEKWKIVNPANLGVVQRYSHHLLTEEENLFEYTYVLIE